MNNCLDCKNNGTQICSVCCSYQGYPDRWEAKPKTNADRIRAMSDEEMAKFLQEDVFYEPWCPDDVVCVLGEGCQLTDKDCGKCALKWLKQEVE